jgi:parvulin-like peptidyl-prolyl isomerase
MKKSLLLMLFIYSTLLGSELGTYFSNNIGDNAQVTLVDVKNIFNKEKKADGDDDDILGTPLYFAAAKGNLEIVKFLLEHKANPNKKTSVSGTPIHSASAYGHLEIVKLLVEAGADKNLKNPFGKKAVYLAQDYPKIVSFLGGSNIEKWWLLHGSDKKCIPPKEVHNMELTPNDLLSNPAFDCKKVQLYNDDKILTIECKISKTTILYYFKNLQRCQQFTDKLVNKKILDKSKEQCSIHVVMIQELNIRDRPWKPSNISGTVKRGDKVCVYNFSGKWARTDKGWLSGKHLSKVRVSSKSEKVSKDTNRVNEQVIKNDFLKAKIKYTIENNKVEFAIKVDNHYKDTKGGISISFPQLKDNARIMQKDGFGFSTIKAFSSNSKLWSGKYKKKIYSDYLLVEGWSDQWRKNSQKAILIDIDTAGLSKLVINVRSVLVKNRNEVVLPTYGEKDQQGYAVKQLVIDLQNSDSHKVIQEEKELIPEKVKARHILVKTEQEAQMLIDMLQNSNDIKKDFIKLAKKYSTGPSSSRGGDLGWFGPDQMVQSFNTAAFALGIGEISKVPVKTQFGLHVIYVEDIQMKSSKLSFTKTANAEKGKRICKKKLHVICGRIMTGMPNTSIRYQYGCAPLAAHHTEEEWDSIQKNRMLIKEIQSICENKIYLEDSDTIHLHSFFRKYSADSGLVPSL